MSEREQPIGLAIRIAALAQRSDDLLDEARLSWDLKERHELAFEAFQCRAAAAALMEKADDQP